MKDERLEQGDKFIAYETGRGVFQRESKTNTKAFPGRLHSGNPMTFIKKTQDIGRFPVITAQVAWTDEKGKHPKVQLDLGAWEIVPERTEQ